MKSFVYTKFQRRRVLRVKQYCSHGSVIDIGSGGGEFGKRLGNKFTVTNIEASFAGVVNDDVIKTDFVSWKTAKRFDVAVFWESLEHLSDPQAYLRHANSLLMKHGYIFVEYPRYFSLESRLFGYHWYHLDVPRHQSQLTDEGISYLLRTSGFHIIYSKPVWAPEYAVVGFAASSLGFTADDLLRKSRNPLFFIVFVPMLVVSCLAEGILFVFRQSPIGLIIAKKN